MLYLIYTREITVGQFFSLFIYSFFIFGPLQELGNIINIYRETEASLNVYEEILRIPKERKPLQAAAPRRPAHAGLRSRHLPAPVGVVSGGQRHLVPRAARRDGGVRRTVGRREDHAGEAPGRPLSAWFRPHPLQRHRQRPTIDLDRLRERIGFVTQDTQLFSGTIRENLLFVNPSATDAECLDVLHRAACDSLLARAERGLDTVIGEGGVKVSGGEKQRLSIARALLRRPQLLVFDEATSSLDSLTEEGIVDTIRRGRRRWRRHHRSHRASPVDHPACRPDLRARTGPHCRDRTARRPRRAEGSVLRDVAAADWRAARCGRWRRAAAPAGVRLMSAPPGGPNQAVSHPRRRATRSFAGRRRQRRRRQRRR